MDDTGLNIPETQETLHAQQQQLIAGGRPAQMFPVGTPELPLPDGHGRLETDRGVFHFNPMLISKDDVLRLSASGRENELLGLGPYSKADIVKRVMAGEDVAVLTERTPDGVEVKAAACTPTTAPEQMAAFERGKSPGNVIEIEHLLHTLARRMKK